MCGLKIFKPFWISLTWTGKIWEAKLSWWRKMSEIGLPFVMARSKSKGSCVQVHCKCYNNKSMWTCILFMLSITLIFFPIGSRFVSTLKLKYFCSFQNQIIFLVRSCFKTSSFLKWYWFTKNSNFRSRLNHMPYGSSL